MSILTTNDFESGELSVPHSEYDDLAIFINKYELKYLMQLLGVNLYKLFVADLTPLSSNAGQQPQADKYKIIFNPLYEEINNVEYKSDGIKQMLMQFVYFHYTREKEYSKTQSGTTENATELGKKKNYVGFNLKKSYNDGVRIFCEIQKYISFKKDETKNDIEPLYQEYNGKGLTTIYF